MNPFDRTIGGGIQSLLDQQRGQPIGGTGAFNFREASEPVMRMAEGGEVKHYLYGGVIQEDTGEFFNPWATSAPAPAPAPAPSSDPGFFNPWAVSLEQAGAAPAPAPAPSSDPGFFNPYAVSLEAAGAAPELTYTDAQVAQALQESMGQGFTLDQSLQGAATIYGVSPEQLSAAQALLAPAPSVAPTAPQTVTQSLASSSTTQPSNSYFAANPDVAAAYQQNTYGLTPDQFAATHWTKYGQYEGRTAPAGVAATPTPAPTLTSTQQAIISAYQTYLGRTPSDAEVQDWVSSGWSPERMNAYIAGSSEAQQKVTDPAQALKLATTSGALASSLQPWIDETTGQAGAQGSSTKIGNYTVTPQGTATPTYATDEYGNQYITGYGTPKLTGYTVSGGTSMFPGEGGKQYASKDTITYDPFGNVIQKEYNVDLGHANHQVLTYDANNKLIDQRTYHDSSFSDFLKMAGAFIPSPLQPVFQAVNAVEAAQRGDYLSALISGAGAAGGFSNLPFDVDPISGASVSTGTFLGIPTSTFQTVAAVGTAAKALQDKNWSGLLNIAANSGLGADVLNTQLGDTGLTLSDATKGASALMAVQNGQYGQAITALGQLAGSKDTVIAGQAAALLQRVQANPNNPSAWISAASQLSSALSSPDRVNKAPVEDKSIKYTPDVIDQLKTAGLTEPSFLEIYGMPPDVKLLYPETLVAGPIPPGTFDRMAVNAAGQPTMLMGGKPIYAESPEAKTFEAPIGTRLATTAEVLAPDSEAVYDPELNAWLIGESPVMSIENQLNLIGMGGAGIPTFEQTQNDILKAIIGGPAGGAGAGEGGEGGDAGGEGAGEGGASGSPTEEIPSGERVTVTGGRLPSYEPGDFGLLEGITVPLPEITTEEAAPEEIPDYTEDLWPVQEEVPDYTEDLFPPMEEAVPDYTQDLGTPMPAPEPVPATVPSAPATLVSAPISMPPVPMLKTTPAPAPAVGLPEIPRTLLPEMLGLFRSKFYEEAEKQREAKEAEKARIEARREEMDSRTAEEEIRKLMQGEESPTSVDELMAYLYDTNRG